MEETLPASWTEDKTGKKRHCYCGYKKIKNNVYGETNGKLSNKTLIIDPVPVTMGTFMEIRRKQWWQ
jgi:hypothetical protein